MIDDIKSIYSCMLVDQEWTWLATIHVIYYTTYNSFGTTSIGTTSISTISIATISIGTISISTISISTITVALYRKRLLFYFSKPKKEHAMC